MSDDYKSNTSTASGSQGETDSDVWDRAKRLAAAHAVENYTLERHRETVDTYATDAFTGLFEENSGSSRRSSSVLSGPDSAYGSVYAHSSGSGESVGPVATSASEYDSTPAYESSSAYASSSAHGSGTAYGSTSASGSGSGKAPVYESPYGTEYTRATEELYSSPGYRVTRTDFSLPDDITPEQAARQRFWDGGLGHSTTYRRASSCPAMPPPVQVASFEAGPPVAPEINRRSYEVKETDYYQAYSKFDYRVPSPRPTSPNTARRRVHWADGYGGGSGSGSKS
ncbi:hypothetical protein F5Y04DRAFT_278417 [Hypomontagnella monticulosa]|nr:hypothetical protein F5Y04DRAFT_278417 [Hypomontagnella monticulosa]